MKWIVPVSVAALVGTSTSGEAAPCGVPDVEVFGAVVRVTDAQGIAASGVVIGEGAVVTAAHILSPGVSVRVAADWGRPRPASVVAVDEHADLALLTVDTSGIPTIDLGTSALREGETVWAAGYPRNAEMHIITGSYLAPYGDRLEIDAWVDSGQSGGALFHCHRGRHRLAGIVHGYIARVSDGRQVNTGRSVSISHASVTAFLDRTRAVQTGN